MAAIGHIGFNWDDYFRARARTMPIAVQSVASTVVLLGVGLPLLFAHGLTGLAIGIGVGAAVSLALRAWYLTRLFEGFVFIRHAARAVLPTVPATGVVLLARALETGPRTAPVALAELLAYAGVTVAATWRLEQPLVREAAGYVAARS